MNKYLIACLSALTISLAACGGGGGSDGVNSSFEGKVTRGTQVYTCKSQKALDACSSTTNTDCSACDLKDSGTSGNTAVINVNCATDATATTFSVTQVGCILKLKNVDQTAVCSGTSLKMLTGTGFTKDKVLASGSTFNGNLTLNNQKIKCV